MNDKWIVVYKDGKEVLTPYEDMKVRLTLEPEEIKRAFPEHLKEKFQEKKVTK